MKPLILALLLILALFVQDSDVKVEYDRFEDRTSVAMFRVPLGRGEIGWLPSPLGVNDPNPLDLTLIATFKGKVAKPPHDDETAYCLISGKRDLGLLSPPGLTLLIDGERITMGTEWAADVASKRTNPKEVKVPLTYALLGKIAKAKAAEGKLGITKFHFQSRLKADILTFINSVSGDTK